MFKDFIKEELVQRRMEGCDVSGFAERIEAALEDESEIEEIYAELMALPVAPDFPYHEPSDLPGIIAARPAAPRAPDADLTEKVWRDKFYGAWLGRCAGCILGRPLETAPFMAGDAGKPGWEWIKLWYEGADAWPIQDYVPPQSPARQAYNNVEWPPVHSMRLQSTRGNITFVESDDDIRYTVLGLKMLEQKGLAWDTWDVGRMWLRHLPHDQVFTAETQAYINLAQLTRHTTRVKPEDWEHRRDWVRRYQNPYRELIGAQIRVDGYAYGVAGNPGLAAELAWRDASLSHVKNGIYGAMFFAALIAAAFVERDVYALVEIGLGQIPADCRLAEDIRTAVAIANAATGQVDLVSRIWEAFNHYHPVHTNNNAALCVAALIFAGDDYEKAITTAVLGGWDTDCNGATVGSITGARLGTAAISERWSRPLNDLLYADIPDFHPIRISECAARSYRVFRRLQ